MGIFEILCIILGIIVVLQFIVFLFINNKYSKTLRGLKTREVDDVTTKNGVRYTIDQTVVDELISSCNSNNSINLSVASRDCPGKLLTL